MRTFFLLMVIVGSALRIGYPMYVSNFTGQRLADMSFYKRGGSWQPVQVQLEPEMFPVGVQIGVSVDAPSERLSQSSDFSLKINGPAGFSSREVLNFQLQPVGDGAAGPPVQKLWQTAAPLHFATAEAYLFTLEPVKPESLSVRSASLKLTTNVATYDGRLLMAGAVMMAVGGLGFLITALKRSRRRRLAKDGKNSRWGRGE